MEYQRAQAALRKKMLNKLSTAAADQMEIQQDNAQDDENNEEEIKLEVQ